MRSRRRASLRVQDRALQNQDNSDILAPMGQRPLLHPERIKVPANACKPD
jgi:hypothetical protein